MDLADLLEQQRVALLPEYQGAAVPKKMNQLGSAGAPVPGSLTRPDPVAQTAELDRVRRELAAAEAREHNGDEAGQLAGEQRRKALSGRPSEPED